MTQLLLFALKRVALARLQAVQSGDTVIAGTDALLGPDVQIAPIMPADPDRIVVYFAPIRSTRAQKTAENGVVFESIPLEIRVRVYSPGEDDEDASSVEKTLDDMCNAVARALLDGAPLASMGNLNLANVSQWPSAVTPAPEPSITGLASVYLQADLVTS